MANLTELKDELEEVLTLKFISGAYLESSAARIIKIRAEFERNRRYYEEVAGVYHIVRVSSALNKVKSKVEEQRKLEAKELAVAITSNQRFYGNLNINTMQEFVKGITDKSTDLLVIGQTGIDYLHMAGIKKQYDSFLFKNDYPTVSEVRTVAEKLRPYNKVMVYHPRFVNMLKQTVGVIDLTQSPEKGEISEEEIIRHIFEPELDEMMDFFEIQVRLVLFNRAMLEADLARTAARLLAMSSAEDRAKEVIHDKKLEIARYKRTQRNAELLDTFTGIKQWKKGK